jgi:uncharacterized protein (TIGR03083 family)
VDVTSDRLLDVGFDAVAAATMPPAGLEGRVLAAAAGARPPRDAGWAATDGALTPLDAFVQTAAELAGLLGTLGPEGWARATRADGAPTVHGLTMHLVGVERYVLGQLGARPPLDAPARELHAPVTRAAAAELLGAPGAAVAGAWWREVLAVAAVCGSAGPGAPVQYHHIPGTVHGLMTVRTFEVWTHGDDVRMAVGADRNALDGPRLSLMSHELVAVLPYGLALTGNARPGSSARLELTGPGGGSFLVPLAPGEQPGAPAVTITTPVIDICRLAANRLSIAELPVEASGDQALVEPVLVGAGAFAMD